MFLTVMVIGLAGLLVMALPAFVRHGIGGGHAAHHALHVKVTPALPGHALIQETNALAAAKSAAGPMRFIPSPRMIFSVLALYGAFGNALERAFHLAPLVAALVAVVPAGLVERFCVTPLWNLVFRFAGPSSSPLAELVLCDATAVTAFRNGRGMVSLVRDGRLVQFAAQLVDADAERQVRVGDRLRVEDLDAQRERLTVSVPQD
jgi:hypothetical protein